ncbi:tubulin-folding cofactor D isoform X2 [Zea mays]|uniref:tubulin-folding cofactor D isoform X2 n=1 Tax=Zea mays TaxID=4577 RepID=UPI0009A9E56B|nr:tubulin-folding cofactor D isoform X2 [Zea mays]|eukprot:XP_020402325.1 tubulin-folding cofactor D [Zea mays]
MQETGATAAAPAAWVSNAATTAPSEPTGSPADVEAFADPTAVGDDEHDSKEVFLRRYFLHEWELVSAILRRIVAGGGVVQSVDVHSVRFLVSYYSKHVLSGLVISTGGLQVSLKKTSTSALVGYLQDSDINTNCEGKSREYILSCDLLSVLQHYQKCDRVITPTLKTIEALE